MKKFNRFRLWFNLIFDRAWGIGVLFAVALSGCASLAPGDLKRSEPAPAEAPILSTFMDPLPGGRAISLFGPRGRRRHEGVDLKKNAGGGDTVVAAGAGTVETARRCRGYGLTVVIAHPDGSRTRYAHLQKLLVDEGRQVSAGEQIGTVGSTGNATTPHLHFEILTALGRCVDPVPYLQAVAVTQSNRLGQPAATAVPQPTATAAAQQADERKEGLPEDVTGNNDFAAWSRKWASVNPSFSADTFERIVSSGVDEGFSRDIRVINAPELRMATKAFYDYFGADREADFKIYSPDRKKFIWHASYPDPLEIDRNVIVFDTAANIYRCLLDCGAASWTEKVFWITNNKLVAVVIGELPGSTASTDNKRFYQHTLYLYDLEKNTAAGYLSPEPIPGDQLPQFDNEPTIRSAAAGMSRSGSSSK